LNTHCLKELRGFFCAYGSLGMLTSRLIVTADHETNGLTLLDTDIQGMIRGTFSTNDHTNIMVPVFAYVPGAEDFKGVYQNNEIFNKILTVFGLNR